MYTRKHPRWDVIAELALLHISCLHKRTCECGFISQDGTQGGGECGSKNV